MTLKYLIDRRNSSLYDEIKTEFQLDVQVYNGREYSTQVFQKKATIYIPEGDYSSALFTHELLHLWLRKKRIFITDFLISRLKIEPLLFWSLTDNLFEQIGHYLEDYKILPEFVKMGYSRDQLIDDSNLPKCTFSNIQIIHSGLKKSIPSMASIDMFINKFFAMKANTGNSIMDYSGRFADLENIDPVLFNILDRFWVAWLNFNVENYHTITNTYKNFTTAFMHELGRWAVQTIHIKKHMQHVA